MHRRKGGPLANDRAEADPYASIRSNGARLSQE